MAKRGPKAKYKPEYAERITELADAGWTDAEIAQELEVSDRTLYRWRNAYPELRQSLKAGKDVADDRVEASLFKRAMGYTRKAVKVMQYQGTPVIVPYEEEVLPDTTACIFWLKNRRPAEWRERHENVNVNVNAHGIVVELVSRIGASKAQELLEAVAPNLLAQLPTTIEGEVA